MSKFKEQKSVIMVLATIFATNHHPSKFFDRQDFNLGAICAVIDNCATATVLNNLSLFDGPLEKVSNVGIVTVGGDDHHPTHKGTAKISWKDDNNLIHEIIIRNALYFPSSPVNVVSVSQLSLQFRDSVSTCDRGT